MLRKKTKLSKGIAFDEEKYKRFTLIPLKQNFKKSRNYKPKEIDPWDKKYNVI